MPWEDLKPMFRPEPGTVHMGVMKLEREKCTKCGLCIQNCPFRVWEVDEDGYPRQKQQYECFSCYNCTVVCQRGAISVVDPYHVDDGVFVTQPHPLPFKYPLPPRDAKGDPDEWNAIERAVFNRRSVRNFRDRPVPEALVRRVLEAGRFAPSAGNCQPWQFIVVTDKALIGEINGAVYNVLNMISTMYNNDALVQTLVPAYEADPRPGTYDPRIIVGGVRAVLRGALPVLLNAPVVILIAGDTRAISGPEINIGICGQNMNLVANSLGIRACWVGFVQVLNLVPPMLDKLGVHDPWKICTSMVLGYPKFKQDGVVPREFRPITWFREGAEGPEIEE
jgi:nitroreductase/NAD-dependent dihydropyrimidine dehydrogenase PreA subunit